MADLRHRFLEEIRAQGVHKVDPDVLHEAVRELDAHLTAAIQARMELGTHPELAELESVRSMGTPKAIVDRLLEVERTPRTVSDGWYVAFATMTAASIALFTFTAWTVPSRSYYILYSIFLLSFVALFALGWMVRRPRIRPVLLSVAVACVIFVFGFGSTLVGHPEWVPTDESSRLADLQRDYIGAQGAVEAIRIFEDSAARFRSGEADPLTESSASGTLTTRQYTTRANGLRRIATYEERVLPRLKKQAATLTSAKEALQAAPAIGLLTVWGAVKLGVSTGFTLSGLAFGAYMLGIVLRFWFELARRRRTRALA
jgi:hypothetical protein